jgi:hypothetical protein
MVALSREWQIGHCSMAARQEIRIVIAFAALYLIWGSTYLGFGLRLKRIPPF